MVEERARRKLTAIMSADVKGYSRLMEDDEEATVRTINTYRKIITSLVKGYRGRVVDAKGDNVLAEFSSAVDAVQSGVRIQEKLKEKNSELPQDRRMDFRIGINLGDVLEAGDAIYGDGVNIAARLESMAEGGGLCISGTVYDQVENKLRLEFEYLGEQSVKNIRKPVRVYRVRMDGAAPGGEVKKELLLPDKPSIAVLPFVNMSGDPEHEYFSDGMTEEIITALSRIPEMFVIARHSTFAYKGKPVNIRQAARELGVRYVLEGSVRKAGDRVRVTAQLIDATNGFHLWAERYDRELKDIFSVQDEVTMNILSALRVKFTHGEHARVQETTNNLEAWSCVIEGLRRFESFTKDDNAKAQELFERAVKADPTYSYAWSMLGWTHWFDATYGYSESGSESFKKAVQIAQKAKELDDKQPDVHALMGGISLVQRQFEDAIADGEKAIALAPNVACNKAILAQTMLFDGRFKEAIRLVHRAMRLNPHYPSWYLQPLAMAYGMIGDHEKAIALYEELLNRRKETGGNVIVPLIGLAANSIFLGREDEAKAYAKEILEVDPNFSLEQFQALNFFKNPSQLKQTVESLRKAGLK